MEIYHGGALDNHGYVTSTNGNLYLKSAVNGAVHIVGYNKPNLIVQSTSVQIKYDNSLKLETTPGGVSISGDIALGSGNLTTTGKLLYANNYDNLGDLPGASTYHGMFAHVHGTGKGYFAHGGAWTELLDVNSSMADLGDVDLTVTLLMVRFLNGSNPLVHGKQ